MMNDPSMGQETSLRDSFKAPTCFIEQPFIAAPSMFVIVDEKYQEMPLYEALQLDMPSAYGQDDMIVFT